VKLYPLPFAPGIGRIRTVHSRATWSSAASRYVRVLARCRPVLLRCPALLSGGLLVRAAFGQWLEIAALTVDNGCMSMGLCEAACPVLTGQTPVLVRPG
jgi:hypothetical protein